MSRYVPVTEVAEIIRAQLRLNFPGVKFSVRSKSYSGGSSIDIGWIDGPTTEEVDAITRQFRGSSFDGMIDLKTYHDSQWNGETVRWGSDYVFTSREYSLERYTEVVKELSRQYNQDVPEIKQNKYTDKKGKVTLGSPHVGDIRWQISSNGATEYLSTLIHRQICKRSFYVHPAQRPKTETTRAGSITVSGVTVTQNEEKDGIEIRFPEKPSEEVLDLLKDNGFKWGKFTKCWYAKRNEERLAIANSLASGETVEINTTEEEAINPNLARAESLRAKADAMQEQINYKKNPAIANQNPTRRRANIAASMYSDGLRMERIQSALYALADAFESDTIPTVLRGISSKSQTEAILTNSEFPSGKWSEKESRALSKIGINPANFESAKYELTNLTDNHRPQIKPTPKEQLIREKERDLIGVKIPGYFPTPKDVVEKMLKLADIRARMTVLEPSAGKGNIADAIAKIDGVTLVTIECCNTLREMLMLKEYMLIGVDFLTHQPTDYEYDRIVMNPPFEQGQDVEHVKHAYNCLKPGGRLVAIMGESAFFRNDGKYKGFLDWLSSVGGKNEALPDGSFLKSEVSTGVRTRIVVIDKVAETPRAEIPAPLVTPTQDRLDSWLGKQPEIPDIEPVVEEEEIDLEALGDGWQTVTFQWTEEEASELWSSLKTARTVASNGQSTLDRMSAMMASLRAEGLID